MDIKRRNYNLGMAILIIGYLTLLCWILGIFLSVEIGIGWQSYTAVAFFGLLLAVSGVLFLISLIFNILDLGKNRGLTRGLLFTVISFPPIAFCYAAILVKALTEGH